VLRHDGRVRFTKGHGTGNDFVILSDPDGRLELTPDLVAALCDRRRGIGGDGLLRVVRTAHHPEAAALASAADWFMDYWNSDGSLAEMCGNGVRVFVRYLHAEGLAEAGAAGLPVATRSGVVRAVPRGEEISVDMGRPRSRGRATATLGALELPGAAVDCGNPHLVCALPTGLELSALDLSVPPGYPAEVFPNGVNVEFVTADPEPVDGADLHVRMRVHERGSGETLSCGSGALAVAWTALTDAGRSTGTVAVDLPGGRLTATCDERTCWLTGPAVLVAHGETDLGTAVPRAPLAARAVSA